MTSHIDHGLCGPGLGRIPDSTKVYPGPSQGYSSRYVYVLASLSDAAWSSKEAP